MSNEKGFKMDELFEGMVEEQAEQMAKQKVNNPEEKAKGLLNTIKEFIKSKGFDDLAKEEAKKNGVEDYTIVKNAFISNLLQRVNKYLNLGVVITSSIVRNAIKFLSNIITVVVKIATVILIKFIDLITLKNYRNKRGC